MVQTATSAPAPETSGTEDRPSTSSDSPQLLYMKTLHDRIKGAKVKMAPQEGVKDEETSGTLIATSFEVTGDIAGTGEYVAIVSYSTYTECACKQSCILCAQ